MGLAVTFIIGAGVGFLIGFDVEINGGIANSMGGKWFGAMREWYVGDFVNIPNMYTESI